VTVNQPVLEVNNLKKYFEQNTNLIQTLLRRGGDPIKAVDDVSFELHENEVKGVIGESGCGKTTLLRTLMGLYGKTGGEIKMHDQRLGDELSWNEYRKDVQIIFQDPFNALNPRMTVEQIISEPLEIHGIGDRGERIYEILESVELNPPEKYLDRQPNQLSGGEKQRVSIARALVTDPEVILADEPVSMLDVSTQAGILNLLSDLIEDMGVSMVYISHDLSTVSYVCDEINVMYLGRIIETAPTLDILQDPKHPYSQELINAIPVPDPDYDRARTTLDGAVPSPEEMGEGCRFKNRCPEQMPICEKKPLEVEEDDRSVACHLYYNHDKYANNGTEQLEGSLK